MYRVKGAEGKVLKDKKPQEGLEHLYKQTKSCSALPSLDREGNLKIVLDCLHRQVSKAKKAGGQLYISGWGVTDSKLLGMNLFVRDSRPVGVKMDD